MSKNTTRSIALLLPAVLFGTGFQAVAQSPVGEISIVTHSGKPVPVRYNLPVKNQYFKSKPQEAQTDANGSYVLKLKPGQEGFVTITTSGETVYLLANKGGKINVDVDSSKEGDAIRITGTNAAGQIELTKRWASYGRSILNYSRLHGKDTTVELLKANVEKEKQADLAMFEGLFATKQIDAQFLQTVKTGLDYYYAGMLSGAGINEFFKVVESPTFRTKPQKMRPEYVTLLADVLKKYPLTNEKALSTPWFLGYANEYLTYYELINRLNAGDTGYVAAAKRNIYPTLRNESWTSMQKNIPAAMIENVAANNLVTWLESEGFEKEMLDRYNFFTKTFPKSPYTAGISPLMTRVNALYENLAKGEMGEHQHLIKDYQSILTFDQLKEKVKGKPVFIDMWATWCSPCRAQFAYKEPLEAFLKKHNIETMYISMDVDDKDAEWKKMVRYYDLPGYHIRTSDSLRKDLSRIFWNSKGYAIPRYVVLNAQGDVVLPQAAIPSEKEKLFKQLTDALHL